jgi:hypothetical protein
MQTPLSVYLLIDNKNNKITEIFNRFYTLLCRDVEKPLSDGLDIPVILISNDENGNIGPIDFTQSEKNAIFFFVDMAVYLGDTKWKNYINGLKKQIEEGVPAILYSVKQFEFATDLSFINKDQMILPPNDDIIAGWDEVSSRIYDCLIRYMKDMSQDKLKLFISHAKRDGLVIAENFRNSIRSKTKLDSFFDKNDIIEGVDFEKQIKENIKSSLLMVLDSDAYGSRQWCQKEILCAKKYCVPIIVVDMHSDVITRTFPYMGNVPSIRLKDDNLDTAINLLLRTGLRYEYQKNYLTKIVKEWNNDDFDILSYQPELLDMHMLEKNNVLYPEPPVSEEERRILNSTKKNFITPLEKEGLLLDGEFISISVSNTNENRPEEIMLRDMVVEISRYILNAGGKILYGGSGSRDGYVNLFSQISEKYGKIKVDSEGKDVPESEAYIYNYYAWPYMNALSDDDMAYLKHCHLCAKQIYPNGISEEQKKLIPSTQDEEGKKQIISSLSHMRDVRCREARAFIIVGGKTNGSLTPIPGILEEYIKARATKKPIYLLGGFGGEAALISQSVISRETIIESIQNDTYESLNNGLNKEENIRLLLSTNVFEIIRLIIRGMKNVIKPKE